MATLSSSVDHHTIGLSPQYWTHTPLFIGDLISLPLINGVDCFTTDHEEPHNNYSILPLSKVKLQGLLTAVDRRPGGCLLLVLDDGTGFIDVRYWDESYNHNGACEWMGLQQPVSLAVGDYCEVLGKIRAMTAGSTTDNSCYHSNDVMDVRVGCVREVHASSVCTMNPRESTNAEVVHWLKCLSFTRDVQRGNIKNGNDVLPLLNDSIVSSIFNHDAIMEPQTTDNFLNKQCCQTPYRFRDALLYCHCQGTLEALDPSFLYRDAVLHKLLDMEEKLQHTSQSTHVQLTEDCMDLIGRPVKDTPPLLFSFESIYKDKQLSSLARELVASTPVPEVNAQQLVQNTFRALTRDGLISLFDAAGDVYLLLSMDRVMKSCYLLGVFNGGSVATPFFIQSVPKKRMNEIRCWFDKVQSDG